MPSRRGRRAAPAAAPASGPESDRADSADRSARITEGALLARAKAGDVAAFEQLSAAYADRLYMLLLRLLEIGRAHV